MTIPCSSMDGPILPRQINSTNGSYNYCQGQDDNDNFPEENGWSVNAPPEQNFPNPSRMKMSGLMAGSKFLVIVLKSCEL